MAESLDFTPVLREIEAKRLASEEKRERLLAIREDKDREVLNKIDQKLKSADSTQKKALEAQKLQIQIDAKERASEGMRVSDQVQAIKDQKDAQADIAKKIEANGGKAEQNLDFLKRNNKIQIEELKLAQSQATSPSQQKEIAKDLRKARIEGLKLALDPVLTPLSQGIGILNKGLGRVVPGLTVGRLALLASIPIIIKFLRSESFKKVVDFLIDNGEGMVRTAVSAIMSIGNFLSFIGKTISETLQFLGVIRKDVDDANEEASRFTPETLGIALGLNILRGAISGIGGLLQSTAARIGFLTGATQVRGKGIAGTFGLKEGQEITDKDNRKFRVTKAGMIQEIDPETGRGLKLQKQAPLLKRLAEEGSLDRVKGVKVEAIKKIGGRGLRTIGLLNAVLKKLPILGQIFAISDIIRILSEDAPMSTKVDDLAGVLGGIGGGALGAILFGAAGGVAGPLGAFVAGGLGGIGGYFAGDILAKGLAQYALSQRVDAFPDIIPGFNINDILNKGLNTPKENPKMLSVPEGGISDLMPDMSSPSIQNFGKVVDLAAPKTSYDKALRMLQSGSGFRREELEAIVAEKSIKDFFGDFDSLSPINLSSVLATDRVDLMAKNATLKSENFEGGGSVAVVNAVTNNDNKNATSIISSNMMTQPDRFVNGAINTALT